MLPAVSEPAVQLFQTGLELAHRALNDPFAPQTLISYFQ